jgi:cobalamin-dependent methionine synthase I
VIVASDRLTASRPAVRRALAARDGEAIARFCRAASSNGAAWIDLNPGHVAARETRAVWRFLVETAEAACGLTLLIDTPSVAAMATALEACSRAPILNMATAAPARCGPVLDLAAASGVDVVCGLFAELVPPDAEGRLAHAATLVAAAAARGIAPSRLVLDPIAMPLAAPDGERHAAAVLELLRLLPLAFDERPRTMVGLSNLTARAAGERPVLAAAPFLHEAHGAGLDVVLADTDDPTLLAAARLCAVFEGGRVFAPAEIAVDRRGVQ